MKIGYILTPHCQMSDIVNSEAILRLHPFNKIYFIAEKISSVSGLSGFSIIADKTYESCPMLDVLIVSGSVNNKNNTIKLAEFIKKQLPNIKYIVGIASGVLALHRAGVIKKNKVTADTHTKLMLKTLSVNLSDRKGVVIDGKVITASHSSGAIEATYTLVRLLHGSWLGRFTEFYLEYEAESHYPNISRKQLLRPPLPRPLNIGVFSAPDIYLPDIIGAAEVFSAIPNSKIHYISNSIKKSRSIFGQGPSFLPTTTYNNCPNLDVLIVGMTHPKYLNDKTVLDFILKQENYASAVITICAGTLLVGATGLFKGKSVTTNYHQQSVLPYIGVKKTDKKLLIDGKFFSAGPAVGSYVAALKALEKVAGYDWAQYVEQEVLEFEPRPIWKVTPKSAGKRIHLLSKIYSLLISKAFIYFLKKNKITT